MAKFGIGALVVAACLIFGPADADADYEILAESWGCGEPRFYPPLTGTSGGLPNSYPVRGPAGALFGRTIGQVRAQLLWWELPMSNGARAQVHRRLLPVLEDVEDNLAGNARAGRHYSIRASDTYGFTARTSVVHDGISYHGLGGAIDVNSRTNPYRLDNRLITDMPAWFVDSWKEAGMCWGGDWVGVKDPMHFSWIGPGASPSYGEIPKPYRPLTDSSDFDEELGSHSPVFASTENPKFVIEASGDGAPDLAHLRPWGDDAVLELLTSRSGFRACGLWRWYLEDPPSGVPHFADLDGASRPDLVYLREEAGQVAISRYSVKEQYQRADDLITSVPFESSDTHIFGDTDGDGIDDLWVIRPGPSPTFTVWNGADRYRSQSASGVLIGVDGANILLYGTADRDVDGDEELAVIAANGNASLITFHEEDSGAPIDAADGPGIGADAIVAFEDYDGDGRPDLQVMPPGGDMIVVAGNAALAGVSATSWFTPSDYECPDDATPYTYTGTFADDEESIFVDDIEWLAGTGITRGCNPPFNDRFCPDDRVTRGQMAAFLTRALGLPSGDREFVDDDASVFEADIGALAAAGITRGCNPPANDRFCPDDPVTRGQMAAFLTRAFDLSPGDREFVDDDASVFEADIGALAAAGITRGCNPPANDRFCPDDPVTRAQMAAFLHRAESRFK